ncbi:helix-turn-helix domain-containing protein [Saccharothrix sp. NPDC042600]|uniref:winged helix-turn-helix domain-containing protein n=1 Tax=Saccharothrix TaxID=2071 RepID=UPI0034026EF5
MPDVVVDEARARSHPLRLALLDLLATGGPLTASQAAARLGVNSGATSFHLRQLARFGLVEPVDGRNHKERPWRLTPADEGDRMDERDDRRYARWRANRDAYPPHWRRQAAATFTLHLTPEELAALSGKILDLVSPYFDREDDPAARPAGCAPVAVVTRLFPLASPEEVAT